MTLPKWEDYWRTGLLASCPTDATGGCTGNLRTAWEQFFLALPDGARVLDIGTGNGVVPLIALANARERSITLKIHGIDLAQIDPPTHVPDGQRLFDGIVFRGGIAAEAMPFDGGYFAAVSGQYVLEYTQHESVLREVRRVMVDGAAARFVLHHATSVVVRNARESLLHADELEHRADAFTDLRAFVSAERNRAATTTTLHSRMIERMQNLHRLAAESKGSNLLAGVLLPALGDLYERRRAMSSTDFNAALDETYRSFKAMEQRLHELIDASLDETAIQHLANVAGECGFCDVQFAPLWHDAENLVGWQLDLVAAAIRPS